MAYSFMMETILGDKVRVKSGSSTGARAIVTGICGDAVQVRLNETSVELELAERDLTNYSLAARRAWKSMPNRRVGRPQGSTTTNRISVTLRIDAQLWERFKAAEREGLIADRSELLDRCLSEMLERVKSLNNR